MAATNDDSPLHLGFCESVSEENVKEIAHRNPNWQNWDGGQVGGRPSWLNPQDLPTTPLVCTNTECTSHNIPLSFIAQLYAPADTVNSNAFHRTLYVFACSSCSSSVRVLRTQLPKENDFYPNDCCDNNVSNDWTKHLPNIKLCKVCGQRGKGECPLQHESFCSKHHQKLHKKLVFDGKNKNDESNTTTEQILIPGVYPIMEVVVEEEPNANDTDNESNRETLFENDDNYDDSDKDLEQSDLNRMTGTTTTTKHDTTTDAFFERVSRAKDQCIRYHQWHEGSELWLSSDHIPTTIPDCQYCGAPRKFEFQLMPQLLSYLKMNNTDSSDTLLSKQQKEALLAASTIVEKADPSQVPSEFKETHERAVQNATSKLLEQKNELDWGVVVVYTCTASCSGDESSNADENELGAYREEYAWVQPSLG